MIWVLWVDDDVVVMEVVGVVQWCGEGVKVVGVVVGAWSKGRRSGECCVDH